MAPVVEFWAPIDEINGKTLDLSHLTSKRFRFIDINLFLTDKRLTIVSVDNLHSHSYTAISYPWRDLELPDGVVPALGQFSFEGTDGAGTMNADVLMTACRAAKLLSKNKCTLIWLDQICIKQTDNEDKNWQIKNMHDIYKRCELCLVLPGGIKWLATLNTPTTWAKRAWTLQEAIVPEHVQCLFEWKKPGMTSAMNSAPVTIVEPFRSASMSLEGVLNAVMTGMNYKLADSDDTKNSNTKSIDSNSGRIHRSDEILQDNEGENEDQWESEDDKESEDLESNELESQSETALEEEDDSHESDWDEYSNSNDADSGEEEEEWIRQRVTMFSPKEAQALWSVDTRESKKSRDIMHAALWKCTLMRTCFKPVDMVFSTMGLFGVQLEPDMYGGNDLQKAALALAQQILQNGGRASWIGVSFNMQPSPLSSTMPAFPEMKAAGGATINTSTGPVSVESLVDTGVLMKNAPAGRMDDAGYFHMKGKAMGIQKAGEATTGSIIKEFRINETSDKWIIVQPNSKVAAEDYAVVVGNRQCNAPGGAGFWRYADDVILMIIQQHGKNPDKYHRKAFAAAEPHLVKHWKKRSFAIGGSAQVA